MRHWLVMAGLSACAVASAAPDVPGLPDGVRTVVGLGGPVDGDGVGPRGAVVRVRRVRGGLPVDDGEAWAHLAPDGSLRALHRPPLPQRWHEGEPLSRAEAIARASTEVALANPHARLAWQRVGDSMRQVWTLHARHPRPGRPTLPVVEIDALTGGVLAVHEGAEAFGGGVPQARVYPLNPVLDGVPIEVGLPLATAGLADDDLEVRQCRDEGELAEVTIDDVDWALHICTEVPADPPVDGDYLYEPVLDADDPAGDEDAFAAPHTYWNTRRVLAWFTDLGWVADSGVDPYLEVVVNQRSTDTWSEATATNPQGALAPYDNAYFTGMFERGDGEWVNARTVYGQGTHADFAYDTDVIVHELGHYLWTSIGGPTKTDPTSFGTANTAKALNEGLADYWSSVIQGDPGVAEFVGSALDREGGVIRTLQGDLHCATDQYGEVHYDGLLIAQALWTARAALPDADTQHLFDQAVLDGIALLDSPATWSNAAGTFAAQVREHVGIGEAQALEAELDRRGLYQCDPILDVVPGPEPFRSFQILNPSRPAAHLGPLPGPVQFRVQVPEGGAFMALSFEQSEYLGLDLYGTNAPLPLEVVGRAGERITWTREDVEVELTSDGEPDVQTLTEWRHDGVWLAASAVTASVEDDTVLRHTYRAELELTEGPWTLQLINPHDRQAVATDLALAILPAPPEPSPPYVPQSSKPAPELPPACGCASATAAPTWVGTLRRRR